MKWIGDKDLDWWALQAIGEIMDASCEAPLLEAYKKTHPLKRSWFWYVLLSRMGSAEAVQLLLDAFDSCDPNVRHIVLDALVGRKAEGLFDRLCAGFEDEKFCNYFSKAAAELADAKTIHRLLEMLDLPEGRRRSSARWGMPFTQDPGAQREILRRLEKETRPALRKDLFQIATDYWFVKSGAKGLEPLLERIAKTPSDPLAAEAAAHLARIKGREGVPQAEEALLATDSPSWTLIAWLSSRGASGPACRRKEGRRMGRPVSGESGNGESPKRAGARPGRAEGRDDAFHRRWRVLFRARGRGPLQNHR